MTKDDQKNKEEIASELEDLVQENAERKVNDEENCASNPLLQLQQKLEDSQGRVLRLQADYDNFRRRTQREKEELSEYAAMKLITRLLPIVDDFERAIEAAETNSQFGASYLAGVELIYRQLVTLLRSEGLIEIEALNLPFDPNFHEAVLTCPAPEGVEPDTVTMVLRKGYMLKDKVIRAAMVQVAHK